MADNPYLTSLQNSLRRTEQSVSGRTKVKEAMLLLSKTFRFDSGKSGVPSEARVIEQVLAAVSSWTLALEGINDVQITEGVKYTLREHKFQTILPGQFRAYCIEASAGRTGETAASGLAGKWEMRKDANGRDMVWNTAWDRGHIRQVIEENRSNLHPDVRRVIEEEGK